jgi:glutathione peroxidase
MPTVYEFSATDIDGNQREFREFAGRVLLIVNVASKCGFTPQYTGLEDLWRKHRDDGLTVLGFPCDQFGHQEPGDESEIRAFCATHYDVTFPLFTKVAVNGNGAHALYRWLKSEQPGILGSQSIKWNFTKFLTDRSGRVVARYAPNVTPAAIEHDLAPLLHSS